MTGPSGVNAGADWPGPVDMVPPPSTASGDAAWNFEEPPALLYSNVIAWVHGWLVPMYRRPVGDGRSLAWCPQWWRHPEAVVRLSALWRGFEQRRTEPGDSMSAWIRDHLDHHMRILNDPAGPLKGCSDDRGHGFVTALRTWKIVEEPAGLAGYLG